MSKSIDVLAEIQQAHATLKEWASVTGMTDDHVQADAMEEVRAAVAELIDALDIAAYGEYLPPSVEQRLRTALARVRGE